eukprot:scaffold4491_cov119-Isochrysis_galbana.AAC.5
MGEGRGSVRTAGGQRSPAMSPLPAHAAEDAALGVCTSRGVSKVAVHREAASSQTWSFIFNRACHAALAGGCLRLRELRMRVRWRTVSWSIGGCASFVESMSGCGNWVAAVPPPCLCIHFPNGLGGRCRVRGR